MKRLIKALFVISLFFMTFNYNVIAASVENKEVYIIDEELDGTIYDQIIITKYHLNENSRNVNQLPSLSLEFKMRDGTIYYSEKISNTMNVYENGEFLATINYVNSNSKLNFTPNFNNSDKY